MSRRDTEKEHHNNKTAEGSLIVVGSGIQAVRHVTLEALQSIEYADKVFYLVADPITGLWIKKLRPDAESLTDYYIEGKRRTRIYSEIVESTLEHVRLGLTVCLLLYGHPGVFAKNISQVSIRKARKEGFSANMFPGISAEDCLFADLGIDPSSPGCQSFEATSFLLHKYKFDTSCHLILWQIGAIGDMGFNPRKDNKHGLIVLTDFLKQYYDSKHEVVVYQAAQYCICKPIIQRVSLDSLPEVYVDYITTLYVPPNLSAADIPIDYRMARRLGLDSELQAMDFNFSLKKFFRLTGK
ncbi:MAG: SAM-dependent methyltransferase [Thermoproteota archaeon]|nr:SAM-dependent methyltransferase [Thermoproteota archaeon]